MSGIYILMATAALGIDFGWERDQNGNIEYTIRLEPQTVDALKNGTDVFSDLPPGLRKVRTYRLTTSTAPLPHQGELPAELSAETEKPAIKESVTAMSPPKSVDSQVVPTNHQEPVQKAIPDLSNGPLLVAATGNNEQPPKSIAVFGEKPTVAKSLSSPVQRAADDDSGSPSDVVPQGVDPNGQTPARPWWPLTLCLLGLFASLGGNVFLGWVTTGQRNKYRQLIQQLRDES